MSRYHFPTEKGHDVVVGWDNPLQTFFADVELKGVMILDTMCGLSRFNINTPEELSELLDEYCGFTIPADILAKLHEDLNGASSPTSLQAKMANIFDIRR